MEKGKESKAIEKKKNGTLSMGAAQFKKALTEQKEKRKLIKDFIKDHMVLGIDYGKIHIFKECPNHKQAWKQKECPDYHFSKFCLFKPGAEKFCELLQLQSDFSKNEKILETLSDEMKKDAIAFRCELFKNDIKVGHGEGACTLSEKKGNLNVAIKIAKKRSLVDAVLGNSIIGLSDIFTQDLEDLPEVKEEKPTLDTICNFGKKHKGKKYRDIPIDYLEWMRDNASKHPEWIDELIREKSEERIKEVAFLPELYACVKGIVGVDIVFVRKVIKEKYKKSMETELTEKEARELMEYLKENK